MSFNITVNNNFRKDDLFQNSGLDIAACITKSFQMFADTNKPHYKLTTDNLQLESVCVLIRSIITKVS